LMRVSPAAVECLLEVTTIPLAVNCNIDVVSAVGTSALHAWERPGCAAHALVSADVPAKAKKTRMHDRMVFDI